MVRRLSVKPEVFTVVFYQSVSQLQAAAFSCLGKDSRTSVVPTGGNNCGVEL